MVMAPPLMRDADGTPNARQAEARVVALEQDNADLEERWRAARLGLGRIVALYRRSSTSYQICLHIRRSYF